VLRTYGVKAFTSATQSVFDSPSENMADLNFELGWNCAVAPGSCVRVIHEPRSEIEAIRMGSDVGHIDTTARLRAKDVVAFARTRERLDPHVLHGRPDFSLDPECRT